MRGEAGPFIDDLTLPTAMVIGGFVSVSLYNSLEIYVSIIRRFRRRRGLYFWSMICANTGIWVTSLFMTLRICNIAGPGPLSLAVNIGWWSMVTGQSIVLYSRLHLVVGDPKQLRWLLGMICSTFVFLEVPTAVLFGIVSFEDHPSKRISAAFHRIEIVQLSVLTLQETLLSGMYVYALARTLKPMEIIKGPRVRRILHQLIVLLVVVVALDLTLVAVQFENYFYIQTSYKPVVYSIKLKVEIFVLSNLVNLIVRPACACQRDTGFTSERRDLGERSDEPCSFPLPSPMTPKDNVASYVDSTLEEGRSDSYFRGDGSSKIQAPKRVLSL